MGRFWLILIPILLLTMAAGGFVTYTQFGHAGASEDHAEEEKKVEEEEEAYGLFMEIPDLIVNPTGTDGRRYLMTSLGIESGDQAVLDEIKLKEVVIRDAVINTLAARSVTELAAIDNRNALKDQLKGKINGLLSAGEIKHLYFTQYVLQ